MKLKNKYRLFLGLIILIGAFVRLVGINSLESGFYVDEAALGYNAKSLIETGTDEYGKAFPLAFRSFGDFKSPLYIYSAIPLVKIFGVTLGVRLTSAFWGILTIWWVAEIARQISDGKKKNKGNWAGLIAGLAIALLPWHVNLSRHAIEAVMATALWAGGLLLILKKKYPEAITVLALSALTYHSTKYVAPLLILLLLFFLFKKKGGRKFNVFMILACLFWVGATMINLQGFSNARALGVASLGINDLWKTIRDMTAAYFSYFSPRVLSLGDWQIRNSVYGISNVPLIVICLFYLGVWQTIKKIRDKDNFKQILLLTALILAPLPASATIDPFHSIRSLIMVVPLSVLAGIGAEWLINRVTQKYKKILLIFVLGTIVWQTFFLTERLLIQNTLVGYDDWAWGYEELVEKTVALDTSEYNKIYVDTTDASAIYSTWLVFGEVDTKEKIPFENGYYDLVKWQSPEKLNIRGNKTIYFKEVYWPKDQLEKKTIFIGSYKRFDPTALKKARAVVLDEVKDKTGKTWWMIVATP